MQIDYLKYHTQFIPLIAKWFHGEWGYYYPELTVNDIEDRLHKRLNIDKIPLALVAIENGEVIGTVSLKVFDMDTRMQYTPWLASMYVREDKRKRGIGRKMVAAIEKRSMELGVEMLYLYTPDAESFYANLGWQRIEYTEYRGAKVCVMKKKLIVDQSR
jgi:N-acetylglutamate synthase-like GNAT family acetyltransferase